MAKACVENSVTEENPQESIAIPRRANLTRHQPGAWGGHGQRHQQNRTSQNTCLQDAEHKIWLGLIKDQFIRAPIWQNYFWSLHHPVAIGLNYVFHITKWHPRSM